MEDRVIQEMLATLTAAHVLAGRISAEDVPSVVAAWAERAAVITSLGYLSGEEGTEHLTQSITKYLQTPVTEWHLQILKRIAPTSVPDKKLSARLMVGSILFAQHVGDMIPVLKRQAAP